MNTTLKLTRQENIRESKLIGKRDEVRELEKKEPREKVSTIFCATLHRIISCNSSFLVQHTSQEIRLTCYLLIVLKYSTMSISRLQTDHSLIEFAIKVRFKRANPTQCKVYDYKRGDFDGLRSFLSRIPLF